MYIKPGMNSAQDADRPTVHPQTQNPHDGGSPGLNSDRLPADPDIPTPCDSSSVHIYIYICIYIYIYTYGLAQGGERPEALDVHIRRVQGAADEVLETLFAKNTRRKKCKTCTKIIGTNYDRPTWCLIN